MAVADLGDLHGIAFNVYAVMDYQEFDFSISDDGQSNPVSRCNAMP